MNQKKRLLFVIPTLRIGGAEKALISLLKAIGPDRYQVDLFLFEHGGELQQEVPSWVTILPEDKVTRAMNLELRYYFMDLIRERKYTAALGRLHITLRSSIRNRLHAKPVLSWPIISKHVAPLPGKYDVAIGFLEGFTDFFVLEKTDATRKFGWIHTAFNKRQTTQEEAALYSQFDKIITISQTCKNAFETVIPEVRGRVEVIENLVLPAVVLERAEEPIPFSWDKGKKHLITIGRLEDVKGIDLAILAGKMLSEQKVEFCWHVFGDGSKRDTLDKQIRDLCLQDRFILEGSVPNPLPYLKAADLFVQPSRQEGKSIALDEAKILGKPIVATNYQSIEDQIEDQKTGIIVNMQPEAIASGIKALLSDPEKCAALGLNCSKLPSQHEMILKKLNYLIDTD